MSQENTQREPSEDLEAARRRGVEQALASASQTLRELADAGDAVAKRGGNMPGNFGEMMREAAHYVETVGDPDYQDDDDDSD